MGMQTDVKAKSLSSSGDVFADRTRVKGMIVVPGTANGSVELKDGGSGGTSIMTISTVANGEPFNVLIPAEGVLFQTSAYAALTGANTAVTVFYG